MKQSRIARRGCALSLVLLALALSACDSATTTSSPSPQLVHYSNDTYRISFSYPSDVLDAAPPEATAPLLDAAGSDFAYVLVNPGAASRPLRFFAVVVTQKTLPGASTASMSKLDTVSKEFLAYSKSTIKGATDWRARGIKLNGLRGVYVEYTQEGKKTCHYHLYRDDSVIDLRASYFPDMPGLRIGGEAALQKVIASFRSW